MLRRTRTTKKLAKRIDLQYFTHPHPFRRWRFWLSVAVPVIALGWLVTQRAQGRTENLFERASLSSHAVFTQQCGFATWPARPLLRPGERPGLPGMPRRAPSPCQSDFHPRVQFVPPGAQRSDIAAATSDSSCTQCHAHLRTRDGKPHYVASISAFTKRHPEFSALRSGKPDPVKVQVQSLCPPATSSHGTE